MLFFEPTECREVIPEEIVETLKALAKRGFKDPTDDLELINLGRTFPLIEKDGKFTYRGVVVGYLRALQPSLPTWVCPTNKPIARNL